MGGKAQLPAQVWSWVGAPALGGGQSRCQCREVSHSCGVRLEFPKKGCPLQGRQRNQLPARCAACAPDWGCAGPCAWSLHKVLQVGSGNPWVVHAGAPGDVYRQGTSGEGGHGVGWGQKKSRGWFSFQVPGRGSRRPRLAARTYATAGGQGVEQGSLSTRNPPWERGGKVRARGGRRGHEGRPRGHVGESRISKPKGHGRQKHKKNGRLRVAGPRQQQGAAGCPAKGWPRMPTSVCTRCRPGWVGWASR